MRVCRNTIVSRPIATLQRTGVSAGQNVIVFLLKYLLYVLRLVRLLGWRKQSYECDTTTHTWDDFHVLRRVRVCVPAGTNCTWRSGFAMSSPPPIS